MKHLLFFIPLFLLPFFIFAQPGASDPNFNTFDNGVYGDGLGVHYFYVWDVAVQQDGKIIIGGEFDTYNGVPAQRIARLNLDGSLDTSFHTANGFNGKVSTISVQSDGKIIVGGDFLEYNGVPSKRLARLNPDGSLDNTFNIGNVLNDNVVDSHILPNGKIVICGLFTFSYNGIGYYKIARLNPDGSPDETFSHYSQFDNQVISTTVQPNGRIIACGSFDNYDNGNVSIKGIARLLLNGDLDTSFNPGTGSNYNVHAAGVLPNGKIVAGGNFTTFNGVSLNRIVCLNPNGSIDNNFSIGSGLNGFVWAISIQADGKIIVAGGFTTYNGVTANRIVRLNQDGSIDNSFNSALPAGVSMQTVFSTTINTNGNILATGDITYTINAASGSGVTSLNTNGDFDTVFHLGVGFNLYVNGTAIQTDGKIIAAGMFRTFNGVRETPRIARLNTDGTLDITFDPGSGFNEYLTSVVIQQDGKIICGGDFITFNGNSIRRVARLNTDGTQDMTFNTGNGANFLVQCLSIQTDGKIIAGGDFTSFNNFPRNRIVRLNANGSVDATFNIGTGFTNSTATVHEIAVQSDGKIIVVGGFTTFNGITVNRIARLNSNGSLDAGFNTGTGFNNAVYAIYIQTDGKILVGGAFNSFNGASVNQLVRLNSDGSLDLTFNYGINQIVESISAQSDGKLIVSNTGNIVRLNTDGSLDNSFSIGLGFNHVIKTVSIQANDEIIVGGNFTKYNNKFKNRIIRLLNACPTTNLNPITTNVSCYGAQDGAILLNPAGGTAPYTFDWGGGITSEDRTNLDSGNYTVVVNDANGCTTSFNTTVMAPSTTINASTQVTDVDCYGGNTGSINLSVSSSNGPCTFAWDNGQVSEDINGLIAGNYSVIISDSTSCSVISTYINEPLSAIQGSTNITNVSCNGGNDGQITVLPNGGMTPYTFDWGGGLNVQNRNALSAGSYSVTITDSNGCSLAITSLITEPMAIVNSLNITTCGSYTWNLQNYLVSGTYSQNFTASNGCDSTVFLNLTVNNVSSESITQTTCNSFTLNGQTYSTSGTYIQHLTNVAGCDSILTLNLIILAPTSHTISASVCNSFTLNGITYTNSGTYIQLLTNSAGCDSILTLDLTIISPSTGTVSVSECGSFSLNGQTYSSSGTYIQNLINSVGCDSILTLVLEINPVPGILVFDNGDGSITASGSDFFQWIDCNTGNSIAGETSPSYSPSENGSYAVIGTTLSGCSDTSECIDIDYLDIIETPIPNISVVPNPTEDLVSIFFNYPSAQITVRDTQGKRILEKMILSGEQVSLQGNADGVYLFEIRTNDNSTIHRVLKN